MSGSRVTAFAFDHDLRLWVLLYIYGGSSRVSHVFRAWAVEAIRRRILNKYNFSGRIKKRRIIKSIISLGPYYGIFVEECPFNIAELRRWTVDVTGFFPSIHTSHNVFPPPPSILTRYR